MTKTKSSRIDPNSRFRFSINTHNSPNRKDIGSQKKVKFAAPGKGSPRSCRLEDSYRPAEREKVTTCADTDPKTSEYAFFKKLKKDVGLGVRSHPLQKDADQSKKPESKRTSDVRVGNKGFNSSRIIEDMSTVKTDSFLSPYGLSRNKSEVYFISSSRKSSQGCGDTFEPQGNQCMHGEIFSRKRQKLRQCVADALSPDMEKLCSKGHDIVPMLLSRLFPTSIQENKYKDPNPGKVVNATGYDLLDSREPDAQIKEHPQIPTRKLVELESSSYFSDHLLSPSDERITPHAEFSTSHFHEFQPLYSTTEPECKLGRNPSFSAKSDVTLGFLFNEQEHETFPSKYFLELGKLKGEPIPLLLEKDFESTADEINLPISCKYAKPDTVLALSTSGNGEERMLKNILGEYHFSPSSLLLDKPQPQEFNSMLNSGLLRYQEFRSGKYVYEDKNDMDANFNHIALSLSHNKHYSELSEDCKNDIDTSCVEDSIYLSPYQHWITRTVSNEYHHYHPDTEAWLTSSLDFISGGRCLSLTSSHLNYQSSNSSTLELPQRESMSSLFNSIDDYEPKMDGGNHGEVLYHFREDLIGIYNFFSSHVHTK